VLSPQFFIWLLPLAALVLLDDALVGGLALATVLMTQVEFPSLYWSLVYLERSAIGVLVARNALLVVTFVAALARLWRLPPSAERRAEARNEPTGETRLAGEIGGASDTALAGETETAGRQG
jgi:hypothetical protein